jgi:class 3 adenylate cyclase
MFKDAEEQAERDILNKTKMGPTSGKNRLKDYLDEADEEADLDKPIADLFQNTIMFADIVGFTAWSSSKEPSQVFTLLENDLSGLR